MPVVFDPTTATFYPASDTGDVPSPPPPPVEASPPPPPPAPPTSSAPPEPEPGMGTTVDTVV